MSCFSSYMTHRDLMAGIHLNEALLLPTGEIFAILLSPGNTIILEPRNRHPPTSLKDCLSGQKLFSLKVECFWQRLRDWFLWKHIATFTILFTFKHYTRVGVLLYFICKFYFIKIIPRDPELQLKKILSWNQNCKNSHSMHGSANANRYKCMLLWACKIRCCCMNRINTNPVADLDRWSWGR